MARTVGLTGGDGSGDDPARPVHGWRESLEFDYSDLPRSVLWTSLAINLLGLALPLVALQIYDRIVPNQAEGTLALLTLGLLVVIVLDTAMKVARSYVLGWESAKAGCAKNIDATRRLLGAPRDEIDAVRPTTWMDRLDALAEINAANAVPARIVLIDLLFIPVYIGLFATVGGLLVLAPIAVIVPMVLLFIKRGGALRERISERAEQDQRKQDFLVECLGGIQAIKAMTMEPQIQRRYERLQKRAAEINYQVINVSQSLQSLGTLASALTSVAVVTAGALIVVGGGNLSIGALACCSLLSGRLMQPVMKGVGIWSEHQSRSVSADRAAPLDALKEVWLQAEGGPARCHGHICLTGVSYAPSQNARETLDAVDLSIMARETVAFRPMDGAAKSALLNIISGQITPTGGRVEIDGRCIRTEWGPQLHAQIVTVSNNSDIFAGTILENLTVFGGRGAVERVRHYARAIGLEASINLLPDGYDTFVGDSVVHELPNGLIQQIAIVRAFAREPAILIIDEAYTSLDSATDKRVQETIARMRGERTIIIAGHRPSYFALADRTLDIVNGGVRSAAPIVPTPPAPHTASEAPLAPAARVPA